MEFSVFGRDVTCDWSIIGIVDTKERNKKMLILIIFPGDSKELTIKGGHLGQLSCPHYQSKVIIFLRSLHVAKSHIDDSERRSAHGKDYISCFPTDRIQKRD